MAAPLTQTDSSCSPSAQSPLPHHTPHPLTWRAWVLGGRLPLCLPGVHHPPCNVEAPAGHILACGSRRGGKGGEGGESRWCEARLGSCKLAGVDTGESRQQQALLHASGLLGKCLRRRIGEAGFGTHTHTLCLMAWLHPPPGGPLSSVWVWVWNRDTRSVLSDCDPWWGCKQQVCPPCSCHSLSTPPQTHPTTQNDTADERQIQPHKTTQNAAQTHLPAAP